MQLDIAGGWSDDTIETIFLLKIGKQDCYLMK